MDVIEVSGAVRLVHTRDVNWTLVEEGDALTLIDTGFPGQFRDVLASIDRIEHKYQDVQAILLTHAHIDHMGGAAKLAKICNAPVYAAAAEVPHAQRHYLEQISPAGVAKLARTPRGLAWAARLVDHGAWHDAPVHAAAPFPAEGPLDLPGHPLPVELAGHTSGHTGFLLAADGVFHAGDAIITGHPLSKKIGPHLLPDPFHADKAVLAAELAKVAAQPADVLLSGHGPVYRGSMEQAAQAASKLALAR
jgi:glyoxylase-like metal-dependent hydrolase (beta-lactamase superfamily II)